MKKKLLATLLLLCMVATILSACGTGANEASQPAETTEAPPASTDSPVKDSVIIALSQSAEPEAGFNPINGWNESEHPHDPLIQSALLKVTPEITLENDLATEYSVSDDGLVWTFKIRSDAKFTDVVQLTAKDVAFTYNTAKGSTTTLDLSMLEKAEAPDDQTVVFTLNKPYSLFAYVTPILGIVQEHAYDSASYGEKPIGSSPYMLKQWDKGQQVIFEANPDYYGEQPKVHTMTIVFMAEDAAYAAVQSGHVDVAYSNASYTVNPIQGYHVHRLEA